MKNKKLIIVIAVCLIAMDLAASQAQQKTGYDFPLPAIIKRPMSWQKRVRIKQQKKLKALKREVAQQELTKRANSETIARWHCFLYSPSGGCI